jgi:hypothetical protein
MRTVSTWVRPARPRLATTSRHPCSRSRGRAAQPRMEGRVPVARGLTVAQEGPVENGDASGPQHVRDTLERGGHGPVGIRCRRFTTTTRSAGRPPPPSRVATRRARGAPRCCPSPRRRSRRRWRRAAPGRDPWVASGGPASGGEADHMLAAARRDFQRAAARRGEPQQFARDQRRGSAAPRAPSAGRRPHPASGPGSPRTAADRGVAPRRCPQAAPGRAPRSGRRQAARGGRGLEPVPALTGDPDEIGASGSGPSTRHRSGAKVRSPAQLLVTRVTSSVTKGW